MNKRKRTEKTVRFDIEHVEIIDTYSAMEYDRGRPTIRLYKVNPNRQLPQLSLDIPTNIHTESSSPDSDDSIETPIDSHKKQKKPKLRVNTSICTDGPLFFTKLSTNHSIHTSDSEEDYLVPITPNCL